MAISGKIVINFKLPIREVFRTGVQERFSKLVEALGFYPSGPIVPPSSVSLVDPIEWLYIQPVPESAL